MNELQTSGRRCTERPQQLTEWHHYSYWQPIDSNNMQPPPRKVRLNFILTSFTRKSIFTINVYFFNFSWYRFIFQFQVKHAAVLKNIHLEQVSKLQAKHQQECELLEDIRFVYFYLLLNRNNDKEYHISDQLTSREIRPLNNWITPPPKSFIYHEQLFK